MEGSIPLQERSNANARRSPASQPVSVVGVRISAVILSTLLMASVAGAKSIPILRPERDFAQIVHLQIPIPDGFNWLEIVPCMQEATRWVLTANKKGRRSGVMRIDRHPKIDAAIGNVIETAWSSPRFFWADVEGVDGRQVNDAFAWRTGVFTSDGEKTRTAVYVHIVDGDAYVLRVNVSASDNASWKALTAAARSASKNVPLLSTSAADPFCDER